MKKFFHIIGLICLFFFSLYLNDKTKVVIKNMDNIMIQINLNKDRYKEKGIDGQIDGKYIIPGISSKIVDVDLSYKKMSKYGRYSEYYYVYKHILPKNSLVNNQDKIIISGNITKRVVSISFIVDNIVELKNIVSILNNTNTKSTFFIDRLLIDSNIYDINNYLNNGFSVCPITCDSYMIKIIKNILKQNNIYYYANDDMICKVKNTNIYNIKGIYIEENFYKNVIDNLNNGSIFIFKYNHNLSLELNYIIKYILSKGYSIENLNNHLKE